MTALEYANNHDNVIVWWVGVGNQEGHIEAWIPPDTDFPFELDKVEGEVNEQGEFVANNLCTDTRGGWRFHDYNGNTIYNIMLWQDKKEYQKQYREWADLPF